MTEKVFISRELILKLKPCNEALAWMEQHPDLSVRELWDICPRAEWMLGAVAKLDAPVDPLIVVRLAVRFARDTPLGDGRTVWDLLTDERSRQGVEVAEAWLRGEITVDELDAAAWDAADVNNKVSYRHTEKDDGTWAASAAGAAASGAVAAADNAAAAYYNSIVAWGAGYNAAATWSAGYTAGRAARAAEIIAGARADVDIWQTQQVRTAIPFDDLFTEE